MVELVDSPASGAGAHSGRGGSTPPSRTSSIPEIVKISGIVFCCCRKKKGGYGPFSQIPHIKRKRACKPGSVRILADSERPSVCGLPLLTGSSRLLGTAGPACVFLHGVAPDRVYSAPLLPGGRVRSYRTFPPLPRRKPRHVAAALSFSEREPLTPGSLSVGMWRYISVALVRGSPLAGVTRYPCPVEPGLSSRTAFGLVPAVVQPARKADFTRRRRICQPKILLPDP